MRAERANHTLTATALVHEAYLRIANNRVVPFEERAHFYASAVQAMRHVLLDHAKSRKRDKRGGDRKRVDLDTPIDLAREDDDFDVEPLDNALARFRARDPRAAQIVELRFYAGLTVEQVAEILNISIRTVHTDWSFARAWLHRELSTTGA